ncbi:MAG: ABC transporter permease, partial [Oscillospiraceae bacterium]|nr:ABC transporter permease [Oscillospiraceae bacterium]
IVMPFMAPFLTLFLFSFLNKRNSSDFYHAIPHKRETLFLSFLAVILTWVLGGMALSTGVALTIFALAPAGVVLINMSSVLLTLLGFAVGSLLVIAATLMAMSITGTTFSNIVTALLILFLPRALITSFIGMVVNMTQVVSMENFGILGDYAYNIVFSFLNSLFAGGLVQGTPFIGHILYTAVLALLYFGATLVLFKRRKSETAQSPALNRVVQAVVRISLAFLITLIAIFIILNGGGIRYNLIFVVAIYALAVIAYFAYELIATKRISSLKRSLPGLLILVLLNVVFITGVNLAQGMILNRDIPAGAVAHVRIHETGFSGGWQEPLSYEELRAREIALSDPQLTDILLDTLAQNIRNIRGEETTGFGWWPVYHYTIFFETTTGRTIRRNLALNPEINEALNEVLNNHPAYREAFLTLPENPEQIWAGVLPEEALRELYNTLRDEVRDLDFAAWRGVSAGFSHRGIHIDVMNDLLDGESDMIFTYGEISIRGFRGVQTYANRYPITSLTPRTAELFFRHTNEAHFDGVARALERMSEEPGRHAWVYAQSFGTLDFISFQLDMFLQAQDRMDAARLLHEAVLAQGTTPIDRSRPYYQLHVSAWFEDTDEHINAEFFFQTVDETLLEVLRSATWG